MAASPILGGLASSASAQQWQAHTPYLEVSGLSLDGETVWAATSGGIFSYSIRTGEIRTYTTVEGMQSIDATGIAADAACGCVWVGYADGVIDRLDVESGRVLSFLDIARATQYQSRRINRLEIRGDSLFVLTDFGAVIFDTRELEVRDAYTRVGTWGAATPMRDVAFVERNGTEEIWLAGDEGVAHAPLSGVNLREPSAWTTERGLARDRAFAVTWLAGGMYVGTNQDALRMEPDGSWTPVGLSGNAVYALAGRGEELIGLEAFSLVRLRADGSRNRYFVSIDGPSGERIPYQFPRSILSGDAGTVWIGDEREGLIRLDELPEVGDQITTPAPIIPDGPSRGLFTDLVVDASGALWMSGATGNFTGFHRLENGIWTDFTARTTAALRGLASFDHIHADGMGRVWAGSAGWGLAMVAEDGSVQVFDEDNSSLRAAAGTDGYVRVLGISSEPDGTVWMINSFTAFPLVHRSPAGEWSSLPAIRASGAPASLSYRTIFVDSHGQKWILADKNQGLLVWDSGELPDDPSDDVARYLRGQGSGGTGLPNESVNAWVEDRSGRVWIGTERGIAYYIAPGLVLSGDPGAYLAQWPITEDELGERRFLLRDLFVNDLAVDPANRLWIASRDGAWLLNAEGTGVLEHYTSDNSPLFSNNVVAVTVDERTGRVFLATDKGLVSLQGTAVSASPEAEPLRIFPNPARFGPDEIAQITIDGLVQETDIRILTVSGASVRSLEGRGGRVVWDGTADDGTKVGSGVYIVAAVGRNGEGTAYGKVALIR